MLINSSDSFVDLLQVKQEKQERQQRQQEGKLTKGESNEGLKTQSSFWAKKGDASLAEASSATSDGFAAYEDLCAYEPCGVEEEDQEHWPMWEMTREDPWRDRDSNISYAAAAVSGENGNNNLDRISSIAECERIFTVPEVYDEMQRQNSTRLFSVVLRDDSSSNGSDQGPCHNILNCFNPWKQPTQVVNLDRDSFPNNAFVDTMSQEQDQHHLNPTGVIKRSSMAVQLYLGMPASRRKSFTPSLFNIRLDEEDEGELGGGDRRKRASIVGNDNLQIFDMGMNGNSVNTTASTEENGNKETTAANKKKYRVHFSELKQVLRIRKFTPEEAIYVWFQRQDFDYFKNEMALLVQQDGASRELAENLLEAKESQHRRDSQSSNTGEEGGDERPDSNAGSSPPRKSRAWWHNYDHSRRGLERYASPGQARQIFASYKVAVKKVLREQQRQRLIRCICIPNAHDPEKIAEVYHEYTAWSRDLALAAGASDADAVRTNFDDDTRHTREYYMLKQVVASGYKVHKHMPQFMLPKCIQPKGFLNEAEVMYLDDKGRDGKKAGSTNLFESMVRNAGLGKALTGEDAREEMSRLDSKDLEGPVSPALMPSLQVENGGVSSKPSMVEQSPRSMAEKAKNYPFQQ